MTLSFSTITPGSFELTPCRVKHGGVDLGATLGNVKVKVETKKAELKADQLGESPIDRRVSGFDVTIETMIAELLNKARWETLFPQGHLVGAGAAFFFDAQLGDSDRDHALPLILHPLSHADGDLTADLLFYLSTCDAKSELTQGPSEQWKMKALWNVYPDFTTTPARYMFYGDPATGLTAASAAAAVAGANTGNGTVSAITVSNSSTKTETITLTCQGAPSAHKSNWSVSGSISGPLGIVQITAGAPGGSANFVSNPINFTITDGGIDFVAGDTFTIATTAANYT